MLFCFMRQVRPLSPTKAEVFIEVTGVINGQKLAIGKLYFPDKPSWTKFYGALQKGSLAIQDIDITMENVPYDPKEGQPITPGGSNKPASQTTPGGQPNAQAKPSDAPRS